MKYLIGLTICLLSTVCLARQSLSTFQVILDVANVREEIQIAPGNTSDSVTIQNPSTNSVSIFVGGSDVTTSGATIGLEVAPGEILNFTSSIRRGTHENIRTSLVFLVSTGTSIPVTIGLTTGHRH